MKYQAIQNLITDEVENDPGGVGYKEAGGAWKSVDAIWALGTAENQTEPDHERKTARAILAAYGPDVTQDILDAFTAAAASHSGLAVALGAIQDYGENGGLDFADQQTVDAIDSLEASGVLTAGQAAKGKALGVKATSRFAIRGIPTNRKHHVRRAREAWEAAQ